ncbi:MAG: DUF3365 domain-containing protein [Nitrospirota bacterium]
MKKWSIIIFVLVLMLSAPAGAEEKLEAIAMTIADYLTAGRIVVAENQQLINDSTKDDKGFTPEVYEKQVSRIFLKRSGIDINSLTPSDDFNKTLIALHETAKEVIAGAQSQINETGKGFKGFIPAIFGKRIGDRFYKKSGITIKQTSMKFRGEYNKPDEFEALVLNKFQTSGKGSTYFEEKKFGDFRVLRYMTPLYIEKSCLTCHGEPAGERDISGRIKEGYKEGELRGAISVIVPFKCVLGNN